MMFAGRLFACVEQTDEATLNAFVQAFLTQGPRGISGLSPARALKDGWLPAHTALQTVCPQVVLEECHLHAQRRMAQALVEYHRQPPEVSPAAWQALLTPHDGVLEASRLFTFVQRLRRLPEVFRTAPVLQQRDASQQRKQHRFTAWTTKPLSKTTTALHQRFT